jgi:hypothetical protein
MFRVTVHIPIIGVWASVTLDAHLVFLMGFLMDFFMGSLMGFLLLFLW